MKFPSGSGGTRFRSADRGSTQGSSATLLLYFSRELLHGEK